MEDNFALVAKPRDSLEDGRAISMMTGIAADEEDVDGPVQVFSVGVHLGVMSGEEVVRLPALLRYASMIDGKLQTMRS